MSIFHVAIGVMAVSLPMDRYHAERFLHKMELDDPGAKYEMQLVDSDYLLVLDSNFRELNRLAHRIDQMDDYQRTVFKAWCHAQDSCTVEDAMRASYHLHSVDLYPGVNSDEMLGEFALDNDIFYEYSELDDDTFAMLDRVKVGARMREQDGGVFSNGGYLLAGDFFGEPLPAEEPLAYFQVRFSDEHRDSGWCDVPLSKADERLITKMFDCEGLSELPFESQSIIPQLNEIASSADELPELDQLNQALVGMSSEEIQKYKALLDVIQPDSSSAALCLAQEMNCYDVTLTYADPAAYAMDFLEREFGMSKKDPTIQYIDLAALGNDELRAAGYESTRYGAVYIEDVEQEITRAEQHGNIAAVCDSKPWLGDYCEYPAYDYGYSFEEIEDIEALAERFEHGNWSIRTGFLYGGLAFVQQVNGGDEWLALRQTTPGEWESFESISMGHILQHSSQDVFEDYVERLVEDYGWIEPASGPVMGGMS